MEFLISLFAEKSLLTFTVLSVIIGGGAAFASGRALALTWSPRFELIFYMVLLGGAIRFFHYGLFEGTLLSFYYYCVDTVVLVGFGLIGYQVTRARQIATQYHWIYTRSSPFSWKDV